jgi:hypothetical protein
MGNQTMNQDDILKNLEQADHAVEQAKAMYNTAPSIELLIALRKHMDKTQDANRAKEGIRSLLTELYPDTAHFIYELLQNAQDANKNKPATTVRFTLSKEELDFEHSGRPFEIKDVEAITNIGKGTKINDPTTIGKFGVGFKSVFAYTNTPEIHSGEYHFRIRDLIIPEETDRRINIVESTRFILPFNNSRKSKENAIYEIESGLKNLPSETLLFLDNIKKIEYVLSDGNTYGVERVDGEDGITAIIINVPNQDEKICYWLRYEKDAVVTDESGKSSSHKVAIAFELVAKDVEKKTREIKPSSPGKVCIFFPAEKETSNLRFCIHAPFASTVARDSIRKDDGNGNNQLRDAIAELVVKSLLDIKKRGWLTVDFLRVLPIPKDELSPFYEPIRKEIVRAFNTMTLVPTKSGSHAPANTLFRAYPGVPPISQIIDDNDLAFFTGRTNRDEPLWTEIVSKEKEDERRASLFLDSLELRSWDDDKLNDVFNPKTDERRENISKWIANHKKDDKYDHNNWLCQLYALLGHNIGKRVDKSIRFVKTTIGIYVNTVESTPYFQPDDGGDMPESLNFVEKETYTTKESKNENISKDAHKFLSELGVKDYDEPEKIQLQLNKYKNIDNQKINQIALEEFRYWDELKVFIDYALKDPARCNVFANESFLIGELDGKLEWVTPEQLKIVPQELEQKVLALKLPDYRVWKGYTDEFCGEKYEAVFEDFLRRVGVKTISADYLLGFIAKKYIPNKYGKVFVEDKSIIPDAQVFLEYADKDITLLKNVLGDKSFVFGSDDEWHEANGICIGIMASYCDICGCVVSHKYGELRPRFEALLKKFEAITYPKIINVGVLSAEYKIIRLRDYLALITNENDINAASLIWKSLCSCLYYNINANNAPDIVNVLKEAKWIPQKKVYNNEPQDDSVVFVIPSDATIKKLPDFFERPAINDNYHPVRRLLEAIEFEKNVRESAYKQDEKIKAAETLGILPVDDIGGLVGVINEMIESGTSVEELRGMIDIKRKNKEHFPKSDVPNPEWRAKKIGEEYDEADLVSYEKRLRSVRTSGPALDTQIYLRDMYTNDDGRMICQICHSVMPFKRRNGEYFFEKIEIASPKKMLHPKEMEVNYLALCPVCAARYQEYVKYAGKAQNVLDVIDNCADGVLEIDIELDKPGKLRFTQKHIGDVKTIIKKNKEL